MTGTSHGKGSGLPPEAYAAALAHLPGIGPARLVSLLRADSPESAWARVVRGDVRRPEREGKGPPGQRLAWVDAARARDVAADWQALNNSGIQVAYFGGARFPALFGADPEPPGVVFWRGDLGVLERSRVAIIGTRHSTSYGRSMAAQLGRDLAENGVCVVSGLALGIDGAAHHGALAAVGGVGPLGVAASGVDCPYPRRHVELWARVTAAGAMLSEAAPGQPAQSWRFPSRNRLIAALAQVVVVVESHRAGGSMLTVAAAADRGVEVMAVPGPVTSPSSLGTNQLLHEGLAPARDAGDVLAALGDLRPWPPAPDLGRITPSRQDRLPLGAPPGQPSHPAAAADGRPGAVRPTHPQPLDKAARQVLEATDRTPTPTSVIADRAGLPIGVLSVVLLQLESLDLVRGQGLWWERTGQ